MTTAMNNNNAAANNANATMGSGKEAVMNNSQTTTATIPTNAKKALCDEIRKLSTDKAEQWIHWAFSTPWKIQDNGVSLIYKGYGFAFDKAYTHLGIRWQGSDWVVTPIPAETTTAVGQTQTIAGKAKAVAEAVRAEKEILKVAHVAAKSTDKYFELSDKMDDDKIAIKENAKDTAYHAVEMTKAAGRTAKSCGLLGVHTALRSLEYTIAIKRIERNLRKASK